MKKITIGLVTYDRPILLKRAVKSILNQSYKNFVLYIGNDYIYKKVTFKSLGIKKTNKIIIFNHNKNLGERDNLNFLLDKSKSEWFCWLGDDDYLHKDFFKTLYKKIVYSKKNNIVASYSNYSRAHLKNDKKINKYFLFNKEDFLVGFTSKKIRLIGTFGLIKVKVLKKINGISKTGPSLKINNINTNHYPYCDPLLAIILSNYGKILWTDERLVYLNTDKNSITARTLEYETYKSAEKFVFKKLKKINLDIKNKDKVNQILENMVYWFLNHRISIIERTNPLINLIRSIKLIIDTHILFENLPSNTNRYPLLKCSSIIFKAIYQSIKLSIGK